MRILVLGGTIFYGRHFTEEALRRGHQVTLFNRGLHSADGLEGANTLSGDRDGGLAPLAKGEWDAVLDTCGYVPRVVRSSAQLLKGRVGQYAFVSSMSVFSDEAEAPIVEDSQVSKLDDPAGEIVDGQTYGGLKYLCEEAVRDVYQQKALVIRPGLIVGPYDTSDRFTYWPWRIHQGGEVVVPDRLDQAVQIIDARDLALWTLGCLEKGICGTFNAVGPSVSFSLGEVFERVCAAVGSDVFFVTIDPKFLLEKGVSPWTELPLWLGEGSDAAMKSDVSKAVGAGLKFRSLEETAKDTLAFALGRGADFPWRNGLAKEKEERLLESWASRPQEAGS